MVDSFFTKLSKTDRLEICFGFVAFLGSIVLASFLFWQEYKRCDWMQASGFITSVSVRNYEYPSSFRLNRHRREFSYSYYFDVGGRHFCNTWIKDVSIHDSQWDQNSTKKECASPEPVKVFYNPLNPNESTLEVPNRGRGLIWFCIVFVPVFYLAPLVRKWRRMAM